MTTYYKVLAEDGSAHHGGSGKWPLPTGKRPGAWMHVNGPIVPCKNGLHLCRKQDLIHWIGPAIFVAETKGKIITDTNKVVVADARLLRRLNTWNDTTARLFAADCASYAVRQCRKNSVTVDERVSDSIKVVYRYARGEATEDELSAARSAARSAAESAVWSAAWSAAESAARSAAESAARSAARSAAWSAAESAAESAVWSAARSAARSAVWSAAESAARSWQTRRLFEYLDGERG